MSQLSQIGWFGWIVIILILLVIIIFMLSYIRAYRTARAEVQEQETALAARIARGDPDAAKERVDHSGPRKQMLYIILSVIAVLGFITGMIILAPQGLINHYQKEQVINQYELSTIDGQGGHFASKVKSNYIVRVQKGHHSQLLKIPITDTNAHAINSGSPKVTIKGKVVKKNFVTHVFYNVSGTISDQEFDLAIPRHSLIQDYNPSPTQ